MKQYRILKDFKGSQDGRFTEQFLKDSVRHLSDSLSDVAVAQKWAESVDASGDHPETDLESSGDHPETEQQEQPAKSKKKK